MRGPVTSAWSARWLCPTAAAMPPVTAAAVFLGYAALNGVTISVIFAEFTTKSIFATFRFRRCTSYAVNAETSSTPVAVVTQ
jgi:FtsH-binding integral membrane protein